MHIFLHFLAGFCTELCPVGGTGVSLVKASKTSNYWRNGFRWMGIIKPAAVYMLAIFFFSLGVDVPT